MPAPGHVNSYYAASQIGLVNYPEISDSERCDVCVIGGGYTGLSTALNLAELGYDIVLLEARKIGWGASGRNGGQVGSGLRWSQAELEKQFGPEKAQLFWDLTEAAKREVIDRIARHGIPCDFKHGVLTAAVTKKCAQSLETEVSHMHERYHHHAERYITREEMQSLLGTSIYYGGTLDTSSGHLHPLNFAIGLASAATDADVRIYEDSKVCSYRKDRQTFVVETIQGATVRSKRIVFACNAYIDRLSPRLSQYIMPIESFIAATEPMHPEMAKQLIRDDIAVCDTKFCLDYYRLSTDKRLLFGGAEAYIPNRRVDVATQIKRRIHKVFPQLENLRIDYAWRGKIAVTLNRLPSIGCIDTDIYYAQGFSGHGVALTNMVGKILAEKIAGSTERFDLMASIPHKTFPGRHFLRWPIHVFGMNYYAMADKIRLWTAAR